MTELLTAAQMRAIEQAAIESGGVTGLELMECAGRGVVEAIFAKWPELQNTSHRVVVLCGPGNNGGDGFVVARLLKERGWEVEVFLYGDPKRLPPDARINYGRWSNLGKVTALTEKNFLEEHPIHGRAIADLYIDAIFGTGLTRRPEGDLENLLRHFGGSAGDDYASRTVAIDSPSGLCLDSGRHLRAKGSDDDVAAPRAKLTVAFDSPKVGHYLQDGPDCCGSIAVADIGVSTHREWTNVQTAQGNQTQRKQRLFKAWLVGNEIGSKDVRARLVPRVPQLVRKHTQAHKYGHGHALVLSGPPGKGGAARLAARGALRIGAGLVTVGCPPAALPENAAQLNSIMLHPIADAAELNRTLEDARLSALCLGPGLGISDRTRDLVLSALRGRRAVVLDADALTTFQADPGALFALLHEECVLTPHAGEFARLFPDIAEKLAEPAQKGPAFSKLDATRDAAVRAGCTVLYKGPDTVIADQTGAARVSSAHYDRAAPWLATAGSGDVLAGFITGLLARGVGPLDAASTAAWLHVECARSFGPGLIAEDIPEELPKVFRALRV